MDLNTLAQTLRNQAKQSASIILDETVLNQTDVNAIRELFLLSDKQYLIITQVKESDIPDPNEGLLTLSVGLLTVFDQVGITPKLTFSIGTNNDVQCLLFIAMKSGWKFTDSFPNLTLFPFNSVTLADSCFIYTSTQNNYIPWSGHAQETISLAAGLNFAAWMTLDIFNGAATLLEQLVDAKTSYLFYGPFSPSLGLPYPVTELALPLSTSSFTITNGLSIGTPSILLAVSQSVNKLQTISLGLEAKTDDLAFSVDMSSSDPALIFQALPLPGQAVTADKILNLPGGEGFQNYIPQELDNAFKACALKNFTIIQSPTSSPIGYVALSIGTVADFSWVLIQDVLTLENISLEVSYLDPFGPAKFAMISMAASCEIFPKIFTGMFDFHLELDEVASKWDIGTISGNYNGIVKLGDLVNGIIGNKSSMPTILNDIVFSDFEANVVKSAGSYSYSIHGQCSATLPMLGTQLLAALAVTAQYSSTDYQVTLEGALLVGQQNFSLKLDLGKTGRVHGSDTSIILGASWEAMGEDYLKFEDIAQAFGFSADDLPHIPDELDLTLNAASLVYDFSKDELLIGLQSVNYGSAIFVALKNSTLQNKWQFFFGLAINKPINLSNLPLISDVLPDDDIVTIKNIQVVISSDVIDDVLATSLNTLINTMGEGYPQVPDSNQQGMAQGVGFSMTMCFGPEQFPLFFSTTQNNNNLLSSTVTSFIPITQPNASDGISWFNVQKSFGPVSIQKIGVQYKDSKLSVLANMSLSAANLTMGLIDFGVSSPITTFEPSFEIQGLDVSYINGSVSVSGGLRGTLSPINFVGELMINMEGFGIAALGGYTTIEGNPSLFLYAVLNAPLGGPPCFFVTGVAAGFGFNRSLLVPDVSGVADFPLVQWAQGQANPPTMDMSGNVGDQVNQVLQRLSDSGIVAPTVGEDWLALGVKFTSFEMVSSFALLIAKFGSEFEIDLLGLSIISIPVGVPVMYAELELLASFKPQEGFIGISGQLTPKSYLLSQDCHLTGGFAFYSWFSGPNQGDFVVTLGGYNPNFSPPFHYPTVPRIGINWNVSNDLIIKGEEYFAVTSIAVMAGGGLSATWNSGGISAWFSVQADFLMVYLPFHYYLDANVDIGASFSISLIFTHITISIHVGATLAIWGPDFTGKATVDLDIISFTIYFGASDQQNNTTIQWSDFMCNLLPSQNDGQKQYLLSEKPRKLANADVDDPSVLHFNVSGGIVKQLSEDGSTLDYVINAEKLEFTVTTTIPIKESTSTQLFQGLVMLAPDILQPKDSSKHVITPNEAFGVGPTGTDNESFKPSFSITVTFGTEEPSPKDESTLQSIRILNNIPSSLWAKKAFDGNAVPVISDPLNNTTLPNAVVGYRIIPIVLTPDRTLPIELQYLQYTLDLNLQSFILSTPFIPTSDSFKDDTVEATIMNQIAQNNRKLLLAVLNQFMPDLSLTVDVTNLADPTTSDLLAEPQMRLLGEQKIMLQQVNL